MVGQEDGRVYAIEAEATDRAGNTAHDFCTDVVPKSQVARDIAAVLDEATGIRNYLSAPARSPQDLGLVPIGLSAHVGRPLAGACNLAHCADGASSSSC